jgi:hypothetical protein
MGRKLVPSFLCVPPLDVPKGACSRCGGSGSIPESIDEDLPDEMVPCFMCQTFCRACSDWVKKSGHECKGKGKSNA